MTSIKDKYQEKFIENIFEHSANLLTFKTCNFQKSDISIFVY